MKYIFNLFKIASVTDMSKHRISTTRYEDLCQ